MKTTRPSGFTLIELMITVAIIGLLAAVAYPSYQDQVRKSRRADGIAKMLEIAQKQERNYSKNHSYSTALDTGLGYTVTEISGVDYTSSAEGHYNVSTASAGCNPVGTVFTCFVVTAIAAGDQVNDTQCRTFTVNDRGQRAAKDANNVDTTATCF